MTLPRLLSTLVSVSLVREKTRCIANCTLITYAVFTWNMESEDTFSASFSRLSKNDGKIFRGITYSKTLIKVTILMCHQYGCTFAWTKGNSQRSLLEIRTQSPLWNQALMKRKHEESLRQENEKALLKCFCKMFRYKLNLMGQ